LINSFLIKGRGVDL